MKVMKKRGFVISLLLMIVFVLGEVPSFRWAVVHDPSVVKVGGTFYVFGSHLQVAKSKDLMYWEQVNTGVYRGNPIVPNIFEDLKEAVSWARADSIWAPHVIQLPDGKFHMYYCASTFGSSRSAIGVAVSDNIEGPYKHRAIIVKSGQIFSTDGPSEDGTPYDPRKHPNAIDPHTFYDKEGRLWMVYGSYFGGIHILELDPVTGLPLPDQGYGKRLAGGNHAAMEGPFILYSPDTGYYYLFLSFGGLDYRGGYNIRVARAERPDGPYYDPEGKPMTECQGGRNVIANYGAKLVGNFILDEDESRLSLSAFGYVSPGHNSAYYDPETGKYFIFFHTRFPGRGESYQLRVHQLFLNEDGWFVMAPFPYAGEENEEVQVEEVVGEYLLINHGKEITSEIKRPKRIFLSKDGSVTGAHTGKWEKKGRYVTLELDGQVYKGVVLKQWHYSESRWVVVFSALSQKGVSVWGIKAE